MILNLYEDKTSNEYFPKSINTKPKNDQGKSYNDQTDKQKDRKKDRKTLRIII